MADSVGLGIIGCGQISSHHIRNSQDDPRVRWVAACDIRREAVEERAAQFDIPGRYTAVADLLADPAVDAVIVATGPEAHLEPTVAAFEAGKHVLVEKPVAIDSAQVEQMLAAQGDLTGACCSSRFRSTPGAHAATEVLASGRLGSIRRLIASSLRPPPANYDGTSPFFLHRPGWGGQGALADWGVYDLDYLLGLTGWTLEPQSICAAMSGVPQVYRQIAGPVNDVEVAVTAQVSFSGDAALDYHRDMFAAVDEPREAWRIECEHGALDLQMLTATPQVILRSFSASGIASEIVVEEAYEWPVIHRGPVIDFVDAIVDGRQPMTSLDNALVVQRVVDGIYRAAAEDSPASCR